MTDAPQRSKMLQIRSIDSPLAHMTGWICMTSHREGIECFHWLNKGIGWNSCAYGRWTTKTFCLLLSKKLACTRSVWDWPKSSAVVSLERVHNTRLFREHANKGILLPPSLTGSEGDVDGSPAHLSEAPCTTYCFAPPLSMQLQQSNAELYSGYLTRFSFMCACTFAKLTIYLWEPLFKRQKYKRKPNPLYSIWIILLYWQWLRGNLVLIAIWAAKEWELSSSRARTIKGILPKLESNGPDQLANSW